METCAHCGMTREALEDSDLTCTQLRARANLRNAHRGHVLDDDGDRVVVRRKPEDLPPH